MSSCAVSVYSLRVLVPCVGSVVRVQVLGPEPLAPPCVPGPFAGCLVRDLDSRVGAICRVCWWGRSVVLGCCIRNPGLVDQTGLVSQLPRATATEHK